MGFARSPGREFGELTLYLIGTSALPEQSRHLSSLPSRIAVPTLIRASPVARRGIVQVLVLFLSGFIILIA